MPLQIYISIIMIGLISNNGNLFNKKCIRDLFYVLNIFNSTRLMQYYHILQRIRITPS